MIPRTMNENETHPLSPFFRPQSVALIGATDRPGSVGRTLLTNLLDKSFQGKIFPVCLSKKEVMGLAAFPKIGAIPQTVDLAIIATPAPTVPALIRECEEAG